MPRSLRLVTEVTSITEITDCEVGALTLAVGRAVGHADEAPLISLLRKLEPGNEVLLHLDQMAREHGFIRAGSTELRTVDTPITEAQS